jgi:hypothetical protein
MRRRSEPFHYTNSQRAAFTKPYDIRLFARGDIESAIYQLNRLSAPTRQDIETRRALKRALKAWPVGSTLD